MGLGATPYFADRWNLFDFLVVAVSLMGLIMGGNGGGGASVLRVFRIARLFRVARFLKGLRMLFETLIVSLPSLANVVALMFLVMVVYAILGVNLFGKVKFGTDLNATDNFQTFGNALMILMRMITGEGWNFIMYDAMNTTDCDSSMECEVGTCCGSPVAATIYFISFTLVGSFVMLNLIIAVVLDNFSSTSNAEARKVREEDIDLFDEVWSHFDPKATSTIPVVLFPRLVALLPPPLGLAKPGVRVTRAELIRFQAGCTMLTLERSALVGQDGGSVLLSYHTVLQALTMKAYGLEWHDLPRPLCRTLVAQATAQTKTIKLKHTDSTVLEPVLPGDVTGKEIERREDVGIAELYAAELMQEYLRRRRARRRAEISLRKSHNTEEDEEAEPSSRVDNNHLVMDANIFNLKRNQSKIASVVEDVLELPSRLLLRDGRPSWRDMAASWRDSVTRSRDVATDSRDSAYSHTSSLPPPSGEDSASSSQETPTAAATATVKTHALQDSPPRGATTLPPPSTVPPRRRLPWFWRRRRSEAQQAHFDYAAHARDLAERRAPLSTDDATGVDYLPIPVKEQRRMSSASPARRSTSIPDIATPSPSAAHRQRPSQRWLLDSTPFNT